MDEEEELKGAIDTGEQEAAPAAPAAGIQEEPAQEPAQAGAPTALAAEPEQPQPGQGGSDRLQAVADAGKQTPMEGIKAFPENFKRLTALLWGADAPPPHVVEQETQKAMAANPGATPDQAAVLSVADQPTDEARHAMLQGHRQAYTAKQSFAAEALKGSPTKPADLNASIQAANQAATHLVDGASIHFSPAQGGVLADISMPSGQRQQVMLNPQQFGQWLNVGGDGLWDRVMDGGSAASLLRIAKGAGGAQSNVGQGATHLNQLAPLQKTPQQPAPPAPQAQLRQDQQPGGYNPNTPEGPGGQYKGEDDGRVQPDEGTLFNPPRGRAAEKGEPGYSEAARRGTDIVQSMDAPINAAGRNQPGHYPGSGNQPGFKGQHDENGHWLGPKPNADPLGYGRQLEQRSRAAFPSVGEERKRQEYMGQDEARRQKLENDIKVANEKGILANKRADITGRWRNEGEKTKAEGGTQRATIYAGAKLESARLMSQAKREQVAAQLMERASKDFNIASRNRTQLIAEKYRGMKTLTPQEEQEAQETISAGAPSLSPARQQQQGHGAPAPAPAPQQHGAPAQNGHGVPPAAQRVVNQVYDTPKGRFKWTGNGWQRAQ